MINIKTVELKVVQNHDKTFLSKLFKTVANFLMNFLDDKPGGQNEKKEKNLYLYPSGFSSSTEYFLVFVLRLNALALKLRPHLNLQHRYLRGGIPSLKVTGNQYDAAEDECRKFVCDVGKIIGLRTVTEQAGYINIPEVENAFRETLSQLQEIKKRHDNFMKDSFHGFESDFAVLNHLDDEAHEILEETAKIIMKKIVIS